MIIDYQGKKYEFLGEYDIPEMGEHFLSGDGEVIQMLPYDDIPPYQRRAIVCPVSATYDYAGIRFVSTGERRRARADEFYLLRNAVMLNTVCGTTASHEILRPISILPEA